MEKEMKFCINCDHYCEEINLPRITSKCEAPENYRLSPITGLKIMNYYDPVSKNVLYDCEWYTNLWK